MDHTEIFEAERPRLVGLASRVLADHAEAEDVVQQAWLRLDRAVTRDATEIENLPAWLTTVTTRLCLDRLTPRERVAFVLHDSFGFEFSTIAAVLDTTPAAARKLASRARAKVTQPSSEDALADWEVVDAFMDAARGGDVERLLQLLAPDAVVGADEAAILVGTPASIQGRDEVATFFNGSAQTALAVFVGDRPASAWFLKGEAKVVFDFDVADGRVRAITFRAAPDVLAQGVRRDGADPR